MYEVQCVCVARAGCGEGPVWDHRTNWLWWVDISGEKVHAHNPQTRENREFEAPCLISSLALTTDGMLIATALGIASLNTHTGAIEFLHNPEPEKRGNRLNDIIAGPDGSLWTGTMSEGGKGATGALYRYNEDGIQPMITGTTISNGLGWSPDGTRLYFVDSVPGVLYVRENGHWSEIRRFDETTGKPDGLAVDSQGTLWIAICDRGEIIGLTPLGEIVDRISLPCEIVTSCAFGGSDLKTLYVTTGTFSMSAEEKAANPLAGGLFEVRMEVPGMESFVALWPRRQSTTTRPN